MAHYISTTSLRYRIAQKILSILYGRPYHYISAWPRAGAAAVVYPVNRNRVLMGLRAGNIEHIGRWAGIGGFVDLPVKETFAQAAVREMWEETGLLPDITKFPPSPHATFFAYNQKKREEIADVACGFYYFTVPDDFIDRLKLQEETAAFRWFTEKECEAMIAEGVIPDDFTDHHQAIRELFRRLKSGQKIPPLPM